MKKGTKLYLKSLVGKKTYYISNVHKNGTYTIKELLTDKYYDRMNEQEIRGLFEVKEC